ncbi:outer membrane lipoprotein carrier protein LolA [Chitinilyticum piscinae]|uniref:Outer membrane lipoprotein carrier protein LolA n=1 Tax=Chitinilyticum piscinae TaxID=2866724 RepID=A0A8J7FEA5_9NEIS|nr:outer membrane lipoprotein carrier protein LolA [Chitinilyticum piscinae]MBE9607818.1 outer membrane lipoprotein carrier protein LolA [Chitinilyticum piscinae]
MKRVLTALLGCLLLSAPALAGVIDDVRVRVALPDAQRGEFRQEKHVATLSKPLISSGQFIYLKPRGLLWRMDRPYASDAVITGEQLIQQVRGKTIARVEARSQPGYSSVSRIFMALVGGDWQALEQDFVIQGKVSGPSWQLELTPKGGLFASFARTLTLSGGKTLEQLDIAEKNGDRTVYVFSNVREAGRLTAAEDALYALK